MVEDEARRFQERLETNLRRRVDGIMKAFREGRPTPHWCTEVTS